MHEPPYKERSSELDKSNGLGPEAQANSQREIRGRAIAQLAGQIYKDQEAYRVHSQRGDWFYHVTPAESGWFCSCPDFVQRGVPPCKHIYAVRFSLNIRETVKVEREKREVVIEQFNATACLSCGSNLLKKFGVRHNVSGDIQRSRCLACSKTFSVNIGFERMKHKSGHFSHELVLQWGEPSKRS